MPVLKFTNDEIGTLLHALRTKAGEWLSYKTFHGSAQNINSVSTILKNTQALEAGIQAVYDNMTDEDDRSRSTRRLPRLRPSAAQPDHRRNRRGGACRQR